MPSHFFVYTSPNSVTDPTALWRPASLKVDLRWPQSVI